MAGNLDITKSINDLFGDNGSKDPGSARKYPATSAVGPANQIQGLPQPGSAEADLTNMDTFGSSFGESGAE
jgi:hypothetical protein